MIKICDVIKYEGSNDTFVWKHPAEDFNFLTQLIVHESQEAIFFRNGEAYDVFGPGRHTLKAQNLPLLTKVIKKFTDDETPFHCEVYFINKTVQMGLFWGTDTRVRFIDPLTEVPLDIGASGEMNLQVFDSKKIVTKLVGTMNGAAWYQNRTKSGAEFGDSREGFTKNLRESFRPLISNAVKTNLALAIKQGGIDILEIDQHLGELSEILRDKIAPGFEEYGLTIPQFYVNTVSLPEDNRDFKNIRELRTINLKKKMVEATAEIQATQAEVDAEVEVANRKRELERQETATEIARRKAERELIEAQTKAQAARLQGLADAEVMAAKGYSHKDEIDAEVQKAYAEGMGKMGSNGGGSGSSGGSMMSDIVSLGIGMQAASAMTGQMNNMFAGFGGNAQAPQQAPSTPVAPVAPAVAQPQNEIQCAKCGNALPANAKFCLECGTKVEILAENEVICPECGKKTLKGKFCMECGASFVVRCAKCGSEIPNGAKFCLECGEKV